MNDDMRDRIHLAGDALLGHRPRRRWPATVGAFILGVVVGVIAAIASLRRTPPPPEPAVTDNEEEARESAASARLSEKATANRSR